MTKTHLLGLSFIPLVGVVCYLAIPEELRHRSAGAAPTKVEIVDRDPRPDPSLGRLVTGDWLFRRNCSGCHGPQGIGGIKNPNFDKDTIPVLNKLARVMKLADADEAKLVIAALEKGEPIQSLDKGDFTNFNVVLAQYDNILNLIRNGQDPKADRRKDKNGPVPLAMPAWSPKLTGDEIHSILAYLLSLQKWEDEEESNADVPPRRPEPTEKTASVPVNTLKEGEALPDAKLVNQDGREFTLSELRGSVVVLSFIYTNCNLASMCPMAASRLAEAQELLTRAGASGVRFLLVSFDPERDTPEKLKEFASRYKVDPSTFWFATGSSEVVGPLARNLNNLYRKSAPGEYDHTIVVALIDANGVLRDDFFGTGWEMDDFVASVKKLTGK